MVKNFRQWAVVAAWFIFALAAAPGAEADVLTVAWDTHPDSRVTGYVLHVGTAPGSYNTAYDTFGNTSFTIQNAVPGQQYYIAVTAYAPTASSPDPLVSGFSAEVSGFSNERPSLINPGSRTGTVGQPVTLQLQGSDPDGGPVSYNAAGLPPGLTLTQSTGFTSGAGTTAGTYAVTATVSDGVLTASQSFTWVMTNSGTPPPTGDTIAPAVQITGPTTSATYTLKAGLIDISGTASDIVGVTRVTWTSDRGGSGTAAGTTGWSIPGVPLKKGPNRIVVSAADAAGNTASDVLTVRGN